MKNVNLEGYHISKLNFTNKLDRPTQLELNFSYNHNVSYARNNTCQGEFTATITDKKHSQKFGLEISVVGIFRHNPNASKEVLHVATYDELFPYVKALVSSITATSGIPALYIPYIDISNQSIYRMDMPVPDDDEESNEYEEYEE